MLNIRIYSWKTLSIKRAYIPIYASLGDSNVKTAWQLKNTRRMATGNVMMERNSVSEHKMDRTVHLVKTSMLDVQPAPGTNVSNVSKATGCSQVNAGRNGGDHSKSRKID